MQNSKRRKLILLAMLLFIVSAACANLGEAIDRILLLGHSPEEIAWSEYETAYETAQAQSQTVEAFGTSYVGTADAQTATAQVQTQPEEQPAEGTQAGTPLSDDLSCTMTVLANLWCRPAPGYAPSDSFTPGLSAEVVGYSPDRLYTFVIGPKGRVCTVPTDPKLVELTGGGCESLPQYTLMPPPTATATFTPSPTMYPTYTPTLLMPSATISPTP